jgi:hypothetical protein
MAERAVLVRKASVGRELLLAKVARVVHQRGRSRAMGQPGPRPEGSPRSQQGKSRLSAKVKSLRSPKTSRRPGQARER